jgi:hypothetical protein
MMIDFNPLKEHKLPYFFRVVFNSPRVGKAHCRFILDELERIGLEHEQA